MPGEHFKVEVPVPANLAETWINQGEPAVSVYLTPGGSSPAALAVMTESCPEPFPDPYGFLPGDVAALIASEMTAGIGWTAEVYGYGWAVGGWVALVRVARVGRVTVSRAKPPRK